MSVEETEVTINANGEVAMRSRAIGDACEAITQEVIDLLGGDVVEHERTVEYFEVVTETVDRQRIGRG